MKKLIARMILWTVEIFSALVLGFIIFAALPFMIYDWALETLKEKPKTSE